MRIEKESSKGGNYVGGLLHMFDWNTKSRKKLFSNKADLTEKPDNKKIIDGKLRTTHLRKLDEGEFVAGSSTREFSEYNCASSRTDDDFYASKAPNVIARLMGLDSMPKSDLLDPNPPLLSDCQSFRSASSKSKNLECFQGKETKHQKVAVVERPIKKIQTEIFPPKSVKSVPITRRKILSPTRSSNFLTSKEAARIMEASAAGIIETREKTNLPLARSSLKVRESKKTSKIDSSVMNGSENKRKSISLALQAKANVRKRESVGKRGTNELSTNREFTAQAQKSSTLTKRSALTGTNALRQNNQKQNCAADSKNTSQFGRKASSGDFSSTGQRDSNKLAGTSGAENDKNRLSEKVGRKKTSFDFGNLEKKNRDAHGSPKVENGNIVDSSGVTDVISFTFAAPLIRQRAVSVGPAQPGKNCTTLSEGSPSEWIMLEHGVKGGDILRSTFLEHKQKELTRDIEFSQHKSGTFDVMSSTVLEQKRMHACSERTLVDRLPSPVSVLDHFSNAESCSSSDTADTSNCSIGDGKHCSSIQLRDVLSRYSTNTILTYEVDTDLSDSASSTSTITKRRDATLTSPYRKKSKSLELDYIRELLSDTETIFKIYALGKTSDVIKPRLSDRLENRKGRSHTRENISRRLIFDCVDECLDMRFGHELWAKGLWSVERKDRLADDVYRDIRSWGSMGHFMVDEIVDNDMGSKRGTWVDYDIEVFEIGMHITSRVLNSLIDEVVDDILVL